MTTPSYPCPSSDSNRFAFNEFTPDPYAAGHVRNEFAAWLGRRLLLPLVTGGRGTILLRRIQRSMAATGVAPPGPRRFPSFK